MTTPLDILIGVSIPIWIVYVSSFVNWLCLNHGLATRSHTIEPKYVDRLGLLLRLMTVGIVVITSLQVILAKMGGG